MASWRQKPSLLKKPGKLTIEEYEIMRTHAELGYKILSQSDRPILRAAAIVAQQHHEFWDGNGYPQGLVGEEIHIFGRIVAIIDVFDALASDRCYRPAMPMAQTLAIITKGYGTHFDPRLLDLFLENLVQFWDLMDHQPDSQEAQEVLEEISLVPV